MFDTIFTVVFAVILLVGYIGYKVVSNKNSKDPDKETKIRERAAEYKRQSVENLYLENTVDSLEYDEE